MKRAPPDRKAQAKRAALNALKRVRRQADRADMKLSDWEGEFLGSVEERVKTYGRAFGDPEKGGAGEALVLTIVAGVAFCGFAAILGFWPGVLAPPTLLVLLGYSLAKRFTWLAHAWLGLALSLAPGGAWVGMGATPNAGIVALMVGVLTWLLGFDVLYALQDEVFDRNEGLHSIPARFGMRGAMRIAMASHVVTVAMLTVTGFALHRGPAFFVGVLAVAVVLVVEHRLVRGKDGTADLAKIPKAFFDCNAYVSMGFFVTTLVDALLR